MSSEVLLVTPWMAGNELVTRGAIAQLGERYNGIVEVGGSIPPGSTTFSNTYINVRELVDSIRT